MSRLLDNITCPMDLAKLNTTDLNTLAGEIRSEIVKTVQQTGGHLGASLGAVEIILALHSVLNSPYDKVIFDVGHQAYAHKIVTGRWQHFSSLRQLGGISGFPRMAESPHDPFGTGHAGTSISAALGYCLARDIQGENYRVAAVIGDGALTSGMAFEALNHAGQVKPNLIIILNDNEMSIARNVGGLSDYLIKLRTDPTYHRLRDDIENLLSRIPAVGGSMRRASRSVREAARTLLVPGRFFTDLGFSYYGPIDGHNISLLQRVLREAINQGGPVIIHAHTCKGRGYAPAEVDPGHLHALSPANRKENGIPSFAQIFGDSLVDLAATDKRIVTITAAMPDGTGLQKFAEAYPERFCDVGIAEEHAVTLAAGLACGGVRPFVAIYSTFMQRAYDQIVHDVCLQDLPVTFCLDRAGLVGEDGATHHGVLDLTFLRSIPNMVVMVPRDGAMLQRMLYTATQINSPVAIRYPRGEAGWPVDGRIEPLQLGQAELLRSGGDIAILAVGNMVKVALEAADLLAAEKIQATVVDARFVKPLDEEMVVKLATQTPCLLTLEENAVLGGFGSAVLEVMAKQQVQTPVRCLGIPDSFVEHGRIEELRQLCGLTPQQVVANARSLWLQVSSLPMESVDG